MRRNWAKGLLFHERQPLAKRRCQPAASEIAVWRLNCWKNAGWGDHLSKIGLSDDAVTDVLDDLSDSVASEVADSSPWASELERIYSDGCIESSVDSIYQWGIAVVAKPLVGEALFRLRCRLKSSEWRSMEMASETERLFLPALKRRLTSLLRRAMILEVNVSRLHGSLNGESPQLRYLDFLRRFLDPANALAFWFEYPALARLVVTIINQWEKNTELFLRRLALDAEDLSAVLTCARPRAIRKVRVGAGDPHRGGQSVTLVEFDSGTRAVYKPRPQAVEKHFRELCDWVNAGLGTSFFHIPAALDRGEYGWAEYIPHKPCANGEEIRLFYLQQGGLLALLHLLQGVDIHSENIIASGKNPVVVDLETLFHPDMAAIEAVSLPDSYKMYQDSALRCHLLPRRWVGEFNEVGRDMSGMGAVPGELWDEAASVTENFHTDEIRITKKRLPSKGTNHLPSVDESPGALADHVGQVEEGFVAVYRLLLAERESLKCPGSPLLAFLNDEVRVVVRPTQEYARLHEEGLHPDLVQDALNREGFLGQLWRRGRIDSWIKRLVPAELKDLHNGDIPYFTARPASRHLWASDGSAIEDILPAPMMSVVLARLDRMNQEDLDRQLSYIRSAIASTVRTIPEVRTNASSSATTASNLGDRGVEKGEVLEWADEIGAKILKLSFRSDSGISWLGLTLVGPDCWELLPLKPDLYSGTSGIALFLGFLGSLTGKAHYCEAAKEVITSARLNLRQLTHQIQRIGAYMGLGGYLYCLAELSDILNLPNTDSEIGRIVRLIESGIELDSWYDVIAGSAGVLAVALRVHEKWDNPLLLRLADSCARHIVNNVGKSRRMRWDGESFDETWSGFSHGAAGIGWALLKAGKALASPEYAACGVRALEFERGLFTTKINNWRRKRSGDLNDFGQTWCHGAPGIGLSRCDLYTLSGDGQIRAECLTALQSTLDFFPIWSDSLCHGDLGNLELFSIGARILRDESFEQVAQERMASIIVNARKDGWRCGTPQTVETPGLMCGLAGIGYGLLRYVDPARVPCVLLLSGPK